MHILFANIIILQFIVYALAGPRYPANQCLSRLVADEIVGGFIELSNGGSFNTTLAEALIAADVVDTSGSVASVINGGQAGPVPLLGPTISGRADFIAENSKQAPTPYKPLNIYYTCNVVIFRFEISFKPQPILGITILELVTAPARNEFPFLIKTIYGELNSFAFLVDLGIIQPPAPPPGSTLEKGRLGSKKN